MNKKIIEELKGAYAINASSSKDKFLDSIRRNDMSCFKFILLQCKYLHSSAILKSLILIVVLTLLCLTAKYEDMMLFVSAGIPLIVLIMIYELETSRIYRMEELEQATRFSLKMLVFSRLLITGLISLIGVAIIATTIYKAKQFPLINIISFFFLPYLITVYACMRVIRKYKDVGLKYCFVVVAIVSLMYVVISRIPKLIVFLIKPSVSILLLAVCMLLVINESKKYIENMEECLWS